MRSLVVFVAFLAAASSRPAGNIPQQLTANGHTTLVSLVVKAGLADALSGPGPFTVFAPTNEAFSALSPELLAKLGSDPDLLKKVLIFHVVPSKLQGASLQNEATPTTLAGGKLRVNLYGPKSAPYVAVNGVPVTSRAIPASNGVIYAIGKVLVPENERSIVGVLAGDSRFSTLVTAAKVADLVSTLDTAGPFTLFAPTDAAFRALPAGALDNLIANPEQLKKVLLGHVVSGTVYFRGVSAGPVPFVSGDSAQVAVARSGITVGSSRIIQADLSATNGVVHVIDKVILPEPQPNIVKVLTSDKRFSTLATAATVAGLISTLESAGPFTLFAPTDDAFRALPAGALDNLIANPEELKKILLSHVVSGKVLSTDLSTGDVPFVSGASTRAVVSPSGVTIGRSNVIQADIAASNGVIHVIDAVILPEPQPNLVKALTSDKRFSTLATAATVAGLIPTLESEGPFTLFAPTDDAFAALPAGALDNLIANPEQLKKVLLGHVVSGKVLSTDLTTGEVPLVSGGIAKAMVARSGVSISGAQVIQADIIASNGVIHVINAVI